jgi:hypothetical protein
VEVSFTPSSDVTVILNTLLDKYEGLFTRHARGNTDNATRSPRCNLEDLALPGYFSQTTPHPRITANEQLQRLEQIGVVKLVWRSGEMGHLLQSVILKIERPSPNTNCAIPSTQHTPLYNLLNREALSDTRSRLETLLLADQFRFPKGDWRTRAIHRIINQLRTGKSPAPFSLSDSTWNLDLLAALLALPNLEAETPHRIFSVRIFNDSKRFDELKPAIVRLARYTNPEWESLTAEDILRELNLVANPNYIHLAGNWQLITQTGEILSLSGFTSSIGFPAVQIETIQAVTVNAESVLCIENLTSFHEYLRTQENTQQNTHHATLCLMGNPSPSIRRLLQLVPERIPIRLWSDMDYGGFNILSQLRKHIRRQTIPYLMDIPTFETYSHLSRPLKQKDIRNLKNLCSRSELDDVHPIIKYLIYRGLKLEQEAVQA